MFWGTGAFGSGEQLNICLKMRETGEQRQFWGTDNIENEDFDFGEQGTRQFILGEQDPHGRTSNMFQAILQKYQNKSFMAEVS